MGKLTQDDDVHFLSEKFKFQQNLEYLPESFINEAESYMNSAQLHICQNNASNIYKELVAFFQPM